MSVTVITLASGSSSGLYLPPCGRNAEPVITATIDSEDPNQVIKVARHTFFTCRAIGPALFCFETESHCSQADLEFIKKTKAAPKLKRPNLPSYTTVMVMTLRKII